MVVACWSLLLLLRGTCAGEIGVVAECCYYVHSWNATSCVFDNTLVVVMVNTNYNCSPELGVHTQAGLQWLS